MHDHDWIEHLRRALLRRVGLTGRVTPHQYVGELTGDPEDFEVVLHDRGITRNALAYFKHETNSDDWSVGSWVYLPDGYFGRLQDHLTIFADGSLYVHREYNWRRHPIKHLRENYFTYPTDEWRQRLHDWGVGYEVVL